MADAHPPSGLKELAAYMREFADPRIEFFDGPTLGDNQATFVLVPNGYKAESIKRFLDEYRAEPERRSGTAVVTDLASFIALVNRFKNEHSAVFAVRDRDAPTLIGVIDYHEAGALGAPRWGKHRTVYQFPLSEQWQAWKGLNGTSMNQTEFAEFIEERILDVMAPPSADDKDDALNILAKTLQGTFAGPAELMSMSRGLAINSDVQVKNAVKLSSGETQIVYAEEHKDDKGKPIKVPNLFVICIPVFDRGAVYRIAVRLRYRLNAGRIVWFYDLYRIDRAFDDAFDEACREAAEDTALPLYFGKPEA